MGDQTRRIREYMSSPDVFRRGYTMEVSTDPEDDDYGFKSLPEYALNKIFLDPLKDFNRTKGGSMKLSDSRRNIPTIVTTPDSPGEVKKKRRAPEPPLGLLGARNKFPSSDDIVRHHLRVSKQGDGYARPKSLSPNRFQADLFDELLVKLKTQTPSPSNSPRMSRTKNILSKLRSPRTVHRGARKHGLTTKEEEDAGFRISSNNSSFDEPDGSFTEETLFFGLICSEMEKDTEFEVNEIV